MAVSIVEQGKEDKTHPSMMAWRVQKLEDQHRWEHKYSD